MKRTLGTCYYPEHWPREMWEADAKAMADAGLTWVRIGEFAWSRIEAKPGQFSWDWLDSAVKILADAGLKVVMGTPTATPPRWMVDRHPDMVALDAEGRPRGFGSRRHYCFSHAGYALECDRIVTLLAERYGANPAVAAWQTDNEYGCHDTTISWSNAARDAFRLWLAARYGDITTLNQAWGNVFWSMDYARFDDIELPNLTVTEPNPAHMLAFRRFSSDQVVRFNRRQVDIIRAHSAAPVSHNYMGRITDFDHFAVGADLDIATWDSYPLGFLEDRVGASPAHQKRFSRQGNPDFQAFHHDLYRAVGHGRWWVMEQQPGPVNWAPYNPAPLPGMVRLWSWEAFAHGAEAVCYFRWRQAPFAQEQMHAGLQRPDGVDAQGMVEARQVASELTAAPEVTPSRSPVALIFDYDADFAWTTQPHGLGLSYFGLVFDHYRALRALGLSVDIVAPNSDDFANYALILAPGLMQMDETLKNKLANAGAQVVLGPRSGARNAEMEIPRPLPPAMPGLDLVVAYVESLRPDTPVPLEQGGAFQAYAETIETREKTGAEVIERTAKGAAAVIQQGDLTYVAGWGDDTALRRILARACDDAGIQTQDLPEGLRCRDTGSERFWFNYNDAPVQFGDIDLPAAGVLRLDLTEAS